MKKKKEIVLYVEGMDLAKQKEIGHRSPGQRSIPAIRLSQKDRSAGYGNTDGRMV
jgi:hypothetical protein